LVHDPLNLGGLLCSPDEYPFSSDLPDPVLPPLKFPKILYPNTVNANPKILSFYVEQFVPRVTRRASEASNGVIGGEQNDDGNYGSAATIDVEVLQSISKRVHYGVPISFFHE
jgi:chorismate mutase